MPCDHWHATELLARAELLASVLYRHPHVSGVALTGSAARLEGHIHDLDLIVFHDGATTSPLRDGSAALPPRALLSCPPSRRLTMFDLLVRSDLAVHLDVARGPVPINVIAVRESILSDCAYLRRLSEEDSTTYREFYYTVFCEIPLFLLLYDQTRGIVAKRIVEQPPRVAYGEGDYAVPLMGIHHLCENGCGPRKPWSERRHEVRARKKQCEAAGI